MPDDPALVRLMAPVLRWRYPLLVVAAYGFCFQHLRGTGGDWRLFVLGSELLFGVHRPWSPLPGGLHVFANYPEVQIGPSSLVLATPFRILGRTNGRIAVALLCTAIAPASVHVLEWAVKAAWRAAEPRSNRLIALTALFGGLAVTQAWAFLATIYARLDEARAGTSARNPRLTRSSSVVGTEPRTARAVAMAASTVATSASQAAKTVPFALAPPPPAAVGPPGASEAEPSLVLESRFGGAVELATSTSPAITPRTTRTSRSPTRPPPCSSTHRVRTGR